MVDIRPPALDRFLSLILDMTHVLLNGDYRVSMWFWAELGCRHQLFLFQWCFASCLTGVQGTVIWSQITLVSLCAFRCLSLRGLGSGLRNKIPPRPSLTLEKQGLLRTECPRNTAPLLLISSMISYMHSQGWLTNSLLVAAEGRERGHLKIFSSNLINSVLIYSTCRF